MMLLGRQPLGALEQIVRDLNGRLHDMATHIPMDGVPYEGRFPGGAADSAVV
jgi:hypothetical protein